MPKPIHILNGPNLNMLGVREPHLYGQDTLADIEKRCAARAEAAGRGLVFRQSNHEGEIVGWIQEARTQAAALIINPAAFTHTSVAIHDALKMLDCPVIEVHLSNIHAREDWRRHSYVSLVATAIIAGFGSFGYEMAVDAALTMTRRAD
ncbi:MAG TPA: type II 3-dehydroquinate dehydratase [Paracoccaceae bacterium]|nr:type II 3-dehydroquinate dehydratase [Paracoccaceae bacterium]